MLNTHIYNNVATFSNFMCDEGFTHKSAWHTLLYATVFSGNTILFELANFAVSTLKSLRLILYAAKGR